MDDLPRMVSADVEEILRQARGSAEHLGRSTVEPRDILLALVREAKGLLAMVFANLGADLEAIRSTLERLTVPGESASDTTPELSEASLRVLRLARMEAYVMFQGRVEAEELLLGLVLADDDQTPRILRENGIEIEGARLALIRARNEWMTTSPSSPGQSNG